MSYASGFVDDVKFAHNGPYGAWLIGRILKVTHQGAATGAKCDVYDCFVFVHISIHLNCGRGSVLLDFDKHCVLLCNELNFICCLQAF